jgi:hypothetical protein
MQHPPRAHCCSWRLDAALACAADWTPRSLVLLFLRAVCGMIDRCGTIDGLFSRSAPPRARARRAEPHVSVQPIGRRVARCAGRRLLAAFTMDVCAESHAARRHSLTTTPGETPLVLPGDTPLN